MRNARFLAPNRRLREKIHKKPRFVIGIENWNFIHKIIYAWKLRFPIDTQFLYESSLFLKQYVICYHFRNKLYFNKYFGLT
jgi:hypothetical protein